MLWNVGAKSVVAVAHRSRRHCQPTKVILVLLHKRVLLIVGNGGEKTLRARYNAPSSQDPERSTVRSHRIGCRLEQREITIWWNITLASCYQDSKYARFFLLEGDSIANSEVIIKFAKHLLVRIIFYIIINFEIKVIHVRVFIINTE